MGRWKIENFQKMGHTSSNKR